MAGELLTLTLFTVAYARHLHFVPTREFVVQLPWLAVPVLSLWALTTAWPVAPFYAEMALWFVSLLVLELSSGRQFYRESIGLMRDAGKIESGHNAPLH